MKPEEDFSSICASDLRKIAKQRRARPGFCADAGTAPPVIGVKELNRLWPNEAKTTQRLPRLDKPNSRFRFADAACNSLGRIQLPLRAPRRVLPILAALGVAPADAPASLGLDALDEYSLYPGAVMNRLVKRAALANESRKYVDGWSIPITRCAGHICAQLSSLASTFFAQTQLLKMYKALMHSSAQKLCNLLKRARPEGTAPETITALEDKAKRRDPSQRMQNAPARFEAPFEAESIRFNE